MTIEKIKDLLVKEFPQARPGFIKVLVDALLLHSSKNHDYNGKGDESRFDMGLPGKFFDINRKFSRLYHAIAEKEQITVNESLRDTAVDLGNYAFLLVEYIDQKS